MESPAPTAATTAGSVVTVMSTSGDPVTLSTEPNSVYGFTAGNIVHFTKSRLNGKVALVRGVGDDGMLWFSLFSSEEEARKPEAWNAEVQTTSCRGKPEYIRQYGWQLAIDQ